MGIPERRAEVYTAKRMDGAPLVVPSLPIALAMGRVGPSGGHSYKGSGQGWVALTQPGRVEVRKRLQAGRLPRLGRKAE